MRSKFDRHEEDNRLVFTRRDLPNDYDVTRDGWDAEQIDNLYFDHALFPEDN